MKPSIFIRAAALLALAAGTSAQAAVIDFDALAAPGWGTTLRPDYSEDGFQLTTNFGFFGSVHANNLLYAGSAGLYNTPLATTSLARAGGGAFSLNSIELADLFSVGRRAYDVTFIGHVLGGGTVNQTFSVSTANVFSPHTFSGFNNLLSVTWKESLTRVHQFDNINVTAVPEPGTYAMLLAGLGLLGFMGRRKRPV